MKKLFLIVVLILISTIFINAHPYTNQLEQGQHRGSFWFQAIQGYEGYVDPILSYSESEYILEGYSLQSFSASFNTGFAGSYIFYEYGIYNFLSAGIKLSLVDFIVHGLTEDVWSFDGSAFINISIFPDIYILFFDEPNFDFFNVSMQVEANRAPLFTDQNYNFYGYGLYNIYSTLSLGIDLINTSDFYISTCFDFKHILCIADENYGGYLSFENVFGEYDSDLIYEYTNGNRFAFCPGIELGWKHFQCLLGLILNYMMILNILYVIILSQANISDYFLFNDITQFELEYVWRF